MTRLKACSYGPLQAGWCVSTTAHLKVGYCVCGYTLCPQTACQQTGTVLILRRMACDWLTLLVNKLPANKRAQSSSLRKACDWFTLPVNRPPANKRVPVSGVQNINVGDSVNDGVTWPACGGGIRGGCIVGP